MIEPYDDDESDDDCARNSYTVGLRGASNMAMVQWANSEREAIAKTASEWGCKPEDCYIYKGRDE